MTLNIRAECHHHNSFSVIILSAIMLDVMAPFLRLVLMKK
jgi:hypothetical protein